MQNLIFLAICILGAARLIIGDRLGEETNLIWYAQNIVAVLVGGGVTVWNSKDVVLNMFKKTEPVVKSEQCFTPEDYEVQDFSSLVHLRNRCLAAKSEEGVNTCSKLADILFQLNNKETATNA